MNEVAKAAVHADPPVALLETSALADVLDELGWPNQVVCPSLRPASADGRLTGWAACACYAERRSGPATGSEDEFNAVDALAAPGRVIVLGLDGDARGAVMGGLMAREFARRGAAGVVTASPIRDLGEIRELGFPVVARGTSPVNGARRLRPVATGRPVTLPGAHGAPIDVHPGDLVVADADGLVIVPRAMAHDVAEATREVMRIERDIVRELDRGVPRLAAMATRPRFKHLAALREKLQAGRAVPVTVQH